MHISNQQSFHINNGLETGIVLSEDQNMGIGIEEPEVKLHIDGNVMLTQGHSYLTEGSDFAEYFQSDNVLEEGDIVGINLENGLARKYMPGDALIGIVTKDAGFIGNNNKELLQEQTHTLVGLSGQLYFNSSQVIIKQGRVYTKDMKQIGILLASGKVFIRMSNY